MPRPQKYTERIDTRRMHEVFGTPRHAYDTLGLGDHIPYPEFYRLWSSGSARERTAKFIVELFSDWQEHLFKVPAAQFRMSDRRREMIAYMHLGEEK